MEINALYEVRHLTRTDLFAESGSGSFDLVQSFTGEGLQAQVDERVRQLLSDPRSAQEWVFADDYDRGFLYEKAELSQASFRIYRTIQPHAEPANPQIIGFLKRYPVLLRALESGDYVEAGMILDKSRKLAQYPHLVSYILGQYGFFALTLYWLHQFDASKEDRLGHLLAQGPALSRYDTQGPYERLFAYCYKTVESKTVDALKREIASKLRTILVTQRKHLVVPVVGCNFRSTLSDLAGLIKQAKREGKKRSLVEGLEGYEARIRRYLETLKIYISPEPYNPHDSHALAVIIEDENQRRLLGYLKRELAAMLSPLMAEGYPFTATLARLSPDQADVEIWI